MRLPRLFRTRRALAPAGAAQDRAERLLAETFRSLGALCARMADRVEAQRLARSGYGAQGTFLERLDRPEPGAPD
ncbi:MAG TPA: hypothetical protein VEJ89_01090 [Myxococcaceae bacterium]|nr:hypothetical protein [Myxococcaceae bacterium]